MKLTYLENPLLIPLAYDTNAKGERTFTVIVTINVTLSDGYQLKIPQGSKTDLASIPNWGWSIFKPIDIAFIADLIHDALWIDKQGQIKHFDNNIYQARKFADEERLRWRKALAPDKKIKNYVTHKIIRLIGGFYYSRQLNIPS